MFSGHDVSDGGVITCLLEMCFGGLCGMDINIKYRQGKPIHILFAEEVGWVLEVLESDVGHCMNVFHVSRFCATFNSLIKMLLLRNSKHTFVFSVFVTTMI